MHFYELHEGDGDVFFDVLLFREEEMDPEEFFTVVNSIRRRIVDAYDADTLVEAIAAELEQDYGFVFVSDDRLTAAVNVSKVEEDNFLAELDPSQLDDEDEAEDEADIDSADYRTILADFEPGEQPPN
ncbi:MAG: hypothetical protein HYX57_07735 [Chloroflexi bacterium]|nr:hypothetical protein [Chloroflexota bacterium]